MKQAEVDCIFGKALNRGEIEQHIQAAQHIAQQVAQLALDYSIAKSEGRLGDAKAIKAEALQLKAQELGLEYAVFVTNNHTEESL